MKLVARDAAGNQSDAYTRPIGIAAGPTEFCVAPKQGCAGGDLGSVPDAITAAKANGGKSQDTIELGEASYSPFSLDTAATVIGLGPEATTVQGAAEGDGLLAGPGSRITQLTVLAAENGTGLRLADGASASDVRVAPGLTCSVDPPAACVPAAPRDGIVLGPDAGATRVAVELPVAGAVGVRGAGPGATLEDSVVTVAGHGVSGVDTVRRSRITAGVGVIVLSGRRAHLDNLLVRPVGKESVGIEVRGESEPSTLVAQHLTVIGHAADPDVTGLKATAAGAASTIELSGSLLRDLDTAVHSASQNVDGLVAPAAVTVDHSSLDAAATSTFGPGEISFGAGNVPAAPGALEDGAEPLPGSPLIDAAAPLHEGDSLLDLHGRPRVSGAAPDIGAVEHQGDAPAVNIAAPASAVAGEPVTVTASGSDPDAGDVLAYAWTFDDGTTATGATVTRTFAAGARSATVTVTDLTGRTGTATATLQVTARPAATATATPSASPPAAPRDTTAPVLGRLRAKVARRRATFTTTLSEPATVVLTVARPRTCRVVRGRRRCVKARVVATRTVDAGAGRLTIRLGRRLAAGRYAVSARATDAAGNDSRRARLRLRVR